MYRQTYTNYRKKPLINFKKILYPLMMNIFEIVAIWISKHITTLKYIRIMYFYISTMKFKLRKFLYDIQCNLYDFVLFQRKF